MSYLELLKQVEKIKHFATGDCDMPKDIRLRCIARICQAVEFEVGSAAKPKGEYQWSSRGTLVLKQASDATTESTKGE